MEKNIKLLRTKPLTPLGFGWFTSTKRSSTPAIKSINVSTNSPSLIQQGSY